MNIQDARTSVDKHLVGFRPNTTSIKPVHIANGLFRAVLHSIAQTRRLNTFVFWQKHTGEVPHGHELDVVFQKLRHDELMDVSIQKDSLADFRRLLKQLLAADDGVFQGQMASYSGAYRGFLTKDTIGQDGGEMIGTWLELIDSGLRQVAEEALQSPSDVISTLCKPLFEETQVYEPEISAREVEWMEKYTEDRGTWRGLEQAAATLTKHLEGHSNKLYALRMVVQFATFAIARHLATLEARYCGDDVPLPVPFLLDFTGEPAGPVAQASIMSYARTSQSISRFYAWAFKRYLIQQGITLGDLRKDPPGYKATPKQEVKEMWELAFRDASSSEDPESVLGQTMYEVMALESEDPIRYFRALGVRSGFLSPPANRQPNKRFAIQQDVLEMLIKSCVEPNSVTNMNQLQQELWQRFGIVVGGREQDDEVLLEAGIFLVDTASLAMNRERFAQRLREMDFAEVLADGILKVELTKSHVRS